MAMAKRPPPMTLHNGGRNVPRQTPRPGKRSERNANDRDRPRANASKTSTDSHPRPKNNSRYGTDPFKTLKAHIESNKIQIIPVAATLPPGRPSCDQENRERYASPACIPLDKSSSSPAKSPYPVRHGTAGRTPASCLELARARAFQDGVLPVHQFIQFNQVFPRPRPMPLTAGKPPDDTPSNGPSMEVIESMYANIGQPVPQHIKARLRKQGLAEYKPGKGAERRLPSANEAARKLQAER
ncbi:hypothetical protein VMCG_07272 [Cytospora schulzeri]|uniref:Uncharacterized protein n=1 Tax=Cytospora schulzeri TaxID=448051 RepID=A0A423WAB8_9PEZI|nr:hypothetical protein VMCG_07272 [Valsa malicola]